MVVYFFMVPWILNFGKFGPVSLFCFVFCCFNVLTFEDLFELYLKICSGWVLTSVYSVDETFLGVSDNHNSDNGFKLRIKPMFLEPEYMIHKGGSFCLRLEKWVEIFSFRIYKRTSSFFVLENFPQVDGFPLLLIDPLLCTAKRTPSVLLRDERRRRRPLY